MDADARHKASRWPLIGLAAFVIGAAGISAVISLTEPRHPPAVPSHDIRTRPPTDRPVIWWSIQPPEDATAVKLIADDWNGAIVGGVSIPCLQPCSFAQSPDGQRLLVGEIPPQNQQAMPAGVYDTAGRRLGTVAASGPVWADDGRRLCTLSVQQAGQSVTPDAPVELDYVDPAGGSRHIATLAAVPLATLTTWTVLACSTRANRAVVARLGQNAVYAIRLFSISTGQLLGDEEFPSGGGTTPVALVTNHDASVAAASIGSGEVELVDLTSGHITEWIGSRGARAQLDGLSWNGKRAVAHDATGYGVVNVDTAQFVWRAPRGSVAGLEATKPTTDTVEVFVSQADGSPPVDVIVYEDGTTHVALGG